MGTKGRAIIGLDVNELLKLLNKAFADEWLAYYQYWVGAKVAKGPMKDAIIAELVQHATEELGHATLVSNRIIQLGGTPLTTPKDWFDWTNCGYDPPNEPFVRILLEQNIKAEQCAIGVYDQLMKLTEGKDPITYNMALTIMEQEVEHEEDLQALLEDLDLMISPPR
ncbi:MAG: ferritin [Desulfuromonadaceae bacterium GWC2_58_13]|nr:MAG: ferritin [Desulfuromonadaceae bacterium GWC2_58_13]